MNTQPEELKAHYSNPKFDGMPWAVDRTRKQKSNVPSRGSSPKVQAATAKIMLLFLPAGLAPLDPAKYTQVEEHVKSILARAMETHEEKRRRKWASYQRAKAEGRN